MGYFDNLENGLLNKYQKILKIKKNLHIFLSFIDWYCFKFHAISLWFVDPSKTVKLKSL
jgi:hypothetical protein